MSQFWESVAERSQGEHAANEFEAAAYRLVVEQVLYHADRHSRTAYWLVERYEKDFRNALAPLGVNVHVNRRLRYAFSIPMHGKAGSASTAQTLMALVLRWIYDQSAITGQLNEDGEVFCDLDNLGVKYAEMTGRELPSKGKLDALMETMKRWGIARLSYDQATHAHEDTIGDQPYAIMIRPAITDLLGETALQRLLKFKTEEVPVDIDEPGREMAHDQSDAETE